MKRFLVFLLAALMIALQTPAAFASDGGQTYKVRIFSGEQGTIYGGEVVEYNLSYGDRVNFNFSSVSLNDNSKYYVKGIRESGRDNNTLGLVSFTVDRDIDYVVAYGLLGDAVSYTINYQDAAGNILAPSETYYGNVGDKPVVAYLYIDGYQPQYYNLTMTLSDNAANNVFTFVYNAVAVAVPAAPAAAENAAEVTTETANGEAAAATEGTEAATAPGTETETATEPGTAEAPTPATNPATNTNPSNTTDTTTPAEETIPEPEEILDLDVPLAEPEAEDSEEGSSAEEPETEETKEFPVGPVVGGVVGLGAVAGVAAFIVNRRKRK